MPRTKYQLPEIKFEVERYMLPSFWCGVSSSFNNSRSLCTLSRASGLHHPNPKSAGARLPRGNETKGADSPVVEKHNHIIPLFFPLLQVSTGIRKRLLCPFFREGHSEEAGSPFEPRCAHLAAQTRIKVCPRLQHTAVQIRSLRMRGSSGT